MRYQDNHQRSSFSSRERKPVILILVEGNDNKTEKQYFLEFNTQKSKYSIIVECPGDTDFPGLLSALKRSISENQLDFELGDKAFIVADLDNSKNKIDYLSKLNEEDYSRFIISNPCFEVWFINHFRYTTHAFLSSKEAIDYLKKDLPYYSKNFSKNRNTRLELEKLISKVPLAIANTKKQLEHFNSTGVLWPNVHCNPYTGVISVMETIIE